MFKKCWRINNHNLKSISTLTCASKSKGHHPRVGLRNIMMFPGFQAFSFLDDEKSKIPPYFMIKRALAEEYLTTTVSIPVKSQ